MILNNSTNINNKKRMFKQWLSTSPRISTNKKESLNNDCQQFLQYQQTKKNLNNDCQQFLQYQQTKKNV